MGSAVLMSLLFLCVFTADAFVIKTAQTTRGRQNYFLKKSLSNTFIKPRRQKRGDCLGSTYKENDCSCCYSECSTESLRQALYIHCGFGSTCTLYLSNQNDAYWTYFKSEETFLSATCYTENCGDSNFGYSCHCQKGYEVLNCDLAIYLPATIVPAVVITFIIVTVCILFRRYKRKNNILKLENQPIKIKCDILIVVDDRDDFKVYTDELMDALKDTLTNIKVERISICHLYIDNYRIKCNKVVFVLHKEYKSLELCMHAVLLKIHFSKWRKTAALFVQVIELDKEILGTNEISNHHYNLPSMSIKNTELCPVSKLNRFQEWLPNAIRVLFNLNLQTDIKRTTTTTKFRYFIKLLLNDNVGYMNNTCGILMDTLDAVLSSNGAGKSPSFETARCKIIVVRDVEEIGNLVDTPELKSSYIFSVMYSNQSINTEDSSLNIYFRERFIKGILDVLLRLRLIKGKHSTRNRKKYGKGLQKIKK